MFDLRRTVAAHGPALRRALPIAFSAAGFLLMPWIVVLAMDVRGHFGARNLSNSWVWLDVMEVSALFLLAALVRRRHRATSPVASATAVLLGLDAFFDLWSAHRGSAYELAQLLAYFAELPSAVVLAALSWYSLAWAADPARGTRAHEEHDPRRRPGSQQDPGARESLRRQERLGDQ
ncbi:hypothetical protein OG455_01135 [Kitasatospora sp. NBC_01287]|uniref:hypothetical protein n=1 Tax=Kitasatospora sp. NBC_01287 TaxID=2903573 RepID=UPI002251FF9C|nr:hypothetical protein [Kitasatospora sp. NBC_01287]MCX4744128.1 hypothetical protein [Kitasatospora sp. NBC_01287]